MKITLESPFKERWERGYLVTNKEPRRNVVLYNSHKDRTTISYGRYLLSVHLGRYLEDCEHVDHINNDKTDDRLENLQILTLEENNIKESRRRGRLLAEIKCPTCQELFTRRKGITQAVDSLKGQVTCCCNKCRNSFLTKNYSKMEREKISRDTLIRVYRSHE